MTCHTPCAWRRPAHAPDAQQGRKAAQRIVGVRVRHSTRLPICLIRPDITLRRAGINGAPPTAYLGCTTKAAAAASHVALIVLPRCSAIVPRQNAPGGKQVSPGELGRVAAVNAL